MNPDHRQRQRQFNGVLLMLFLIVVFGTRRCDREETSTPPPGRVSTPVSNPIEEALTPPASEYKEGVAAAILIDTSGSMNEEVKDTDGTRRRKIEIARRAALDIVNQFDTFARDHADKEIVLGIFEFSDRREGPPCRPVVNMGPPEPDAARTAISRMRPEGGTPIGDAMIVAKRALDARGLSKRHILVITDGENTKGYSPADVTRVISSQQDNDRASIYFVAFDVAAAKFNSVKDAGGLVLAASNETELQGTLNYLLSGKILAEQPEQR